MRPLCRYVVLLATVAAFSTLVHSQKPSKQRAQTHKSAPTTQSQTSSGSLTIKSEPGAIVWVDDVRRGVTDSSGTLTLTKVTGGRHVIRVRATGFKESSTPVLPGRSHLAARLVRTTDEAELKFQQAEEAREKAKDDDARQQAVDLYSQALKLRASFPVAHVGLARALMDLNKNENALSEIEAARKSRPSYPEASAVEGRIFREMAFADEATKSFQRAIREANGFQPEAHVGLARVYEDRGQYEAAAAEYQVAIKQLSDSEPVIYQLLGATYEKLEKYKEAVAAYEKYLQLAPNGSLAPAIRSIIDQVRREASSREIVP
ncbi:MAG TPA: tetratricopeptide repeat protein [Pyrinomonadaceae bacterium]|nr:tetratricopeptide repeat protein [Pyrinomonadaceae bacterium]